MISTDALDHVLAGAPLGSALPAFRAALAAAPDPRRHGDAAALDAALAALPEARASSRDFGAGTVRIGCASDLDAGGAETLTQCLMALHPWRKGPFELLGVGVDSEWRSDLKWARVADAISPLAGRLVLDVGCGNGYYLWRMLGAGARFVLGVDPALRCLAQFLAVKRYAPDAPALLLPLGSEQLPQGSRAFDTVFSMGVIYHRRDPLAHLAELRGQLRAGGELVLETLVAPGTAPAVLDPAGRYAKMRNVWCIPTPAALLGWLEDAGFGAARIVDISPTTVAEQRRTAWMRFESLADFLDPQDPSRTVEGHPAPVRAVAVATLEP